MKNMEGLFVEGLAFMLPPFILFFIGDIQALFIIFFFLLSFLVFTHLSKTLEESEKNLGEGVKRVIYSILPSGAFLFSLKSLDFSTYPNLDFWDRLGIMSGVIISLIALFAILLYIKICQKDAEEEEDSKRRWHGITGKR